MDNFDEGKKGFDSTCKVPWSSILKERKGGSFLTKLEMGRVSLPAPSKLPRINVKTLFFIILEIYVDNRKSVRVNNTFNFLILRNFIFISHISSL